MISQPGVAAFLYFRVDVFIKTSVPPHFTKFKMATTAERPAETKFGKSTFFHYALLTCPF
jgi:hypothetical protein